MPSFATYTLGCKVNQAETSQIEQLLQENGYEPVAFSAQADVYIINTCAVTHVADRKSRHFIRRAKRNNPKAKVIVTGCFSEKAGSAALGSDIDLIVANEDKLSADKWQAILPPKGKNKTALAKPAQPALKVRQLLKVQDGCTTFCTYCIVPYLRTKPYSQPLPEIIATAKKWVAAGTREIVLTGVNLGNYAWAGQTLLTVVQELSKLDGLWRIRLSSLELADVTPALIRQLKMDPKVCAHLHLPLQSGSDQILARMGRPYRLKDFQKIVAELREQLPDIAITTDVIVGFPGETKTDFLGTVNAVQDLRFSRLHVFKFSPRPGTPAAEFPDKIRPEVLQERSSLLISLGQELEHSFAAQYLDRELSVLFEEEEQGLASGLTGNYLRAKTRQKDLVGKIQLLKPRRLLGQVLFS